MASSGLHPRLRAVGVEEVDGIGLEDGAGEGAAFSGTGVEAEAVRFDDGLGARGVAVDDDAIGGLGQHDAVVAEEGVTDPEHVGFALLDQGDAGADAGVDEKVSADGEIDAEIPEQDKMPRWDRDEPVAGLAGGFEAPAGEGLVAAIVEPAVDVFRIVGAGGVRGLQCVEHHPFMVAHEVDAGDPAQGGAVCEKRDHAGGVGAAVDEIAEVDEQGVRDGPAEEVAADPFMDAFELGAVAMDVADDVDAAALLEAAFLQGGNV